MSPIVITKVEQFGSHTLIVIMKRRQFGSYTLIVIMKEQQFGSHSDRYDKKTTTHEFVAEIQAMIIENDSTKSTGPLPRTCEYLSFFIRLVVHGDIQNFSYKMKKGQFLSQAMKDKGFGLVYGISTVVGYLMPNRFFTQMNSSISNNSIYYKYTV